MSSEQLSLDELVTEFKERANGRRRVPPAGRSAAFEKQLLKARKDKARRDERNALSLVLRAFPGSVEVPCPPTEGEQ